MPEVEQCSAFAVTDLAGSGCGRVTILQRPAGSNPRAHIFVSLVDARALALRHARIRLLTPLAVERFQVSLACRTGGRSTGTFVGNRMVA